MVLQKNRNKLLHLWDSFDFGYVHRLRIQQVCLFISRTEHVNSNADCCNISMRVTHFNLIRSTVCAPIYNCDCVCGNKAFGMFSMKCSKKGKEEEKTE